MKNLLMLFFLWLGYISSYAQVNKPNYTLDSQPITTTGISLPQLITTDINRSELQFGANLSSGLNQPNLTANFKKFISDKSKQFTITSAAHMNHSLSFNRNDSQDFYNLNSLSLNLGADLKLFNKNNYFFQIGTQNRITKYGELKEFDFIFASSSITLGIGKGRIDFVNDGAAAISIVEKLSEYGILKRDLSNEEYALLTQRVRELKNRRKFVNRSFPLTESEEIQDLLMAFGLLNENEDVTAIINDAYKFEPLLDRTVGSQFKIAASGSYSGTNLPYNFGRVGLSASLSYMIHSPINSKWQYNKGIIGYISSSDQNLESPNFNEERIEKASIGIRNDLHYLVDTRTRLSFLSEVGYIFTNKFLILDPLGTQLYDDKGFYLNTRTEVEYQISRTMSTTFGLDLRFAPRNTYTGLRLGLNF